MSVDRKEIDLIIRAAVQGQNNLPAVTKSIADLEKAINSQAQAAKRGEVSLDELKATLLALQQAQDKLKNQADLIGQFQKLSEQITKSADKLDKSIKTHQEYKAKVEASGKATEVQTERLNKYAAATDRAEKSVERQKSQQLSLQKILQQSGIDVDNLATSENTLRSSAAQLGVAIVKSQQSIGSFSDDLRRAKDAQKALSDTETFNKQAEEARKLVKASEYVNFWESALNKLDVTQKQLSVNNTLRTVADEAVATARGYTTLGKSIANISTSGPQLASTIRSIIDPAKQSRASLIGLEQELDKVKTGIEKAKGPVKDYAENIKLLSNIQKSIQTKSVAIDDFGKQILSLRQARAEFSNARKDVLSYADSLRKSTGDNELLLSSLARAKSRLEQAAKGLNDEINSTRTLRNELRNADISTSNLAASQARLTSAAKNTVSALTTLSDRFNKYGQTVNKSANVHDKFNSGGRTTLSLMQRVKGELLAATAAYVGFYGVINQGSKILEAYNTRQSIQSQLSISVGNDAKAIAEEYAYLQGQAERLGVSFEVLATGYAKFLASGALAGRTKNELRVIFESFTEVGRVANVTKDNMDGVFNALGQILSKGKIQSEELRGQLGDRLFGAFGTAAEALKKEFPNFDKALKDGLVTSDYLLKIAEKYREVVANQLPNATKSLAAEQERLATSIFNFKTLIADSGFTKAYGEFVTKLTTFFKSADGKKFAESTSKAFTILTDTLIYLLQHLDEVVAIGKIVLTIYTGKMFFDTVFGIRQFIVELRNLASVLRGLPLLLTGVGALLTVGVVLYTQVKPFREFVNEFVKGLGEVAEAFAKASKEKGIFAGIKAAYDKGVDLNKPSISSARNTELRDINSRKNVINQQLSEGMKPYVSLIGIESQNAKVALSSLEKTKLKAELAQLEGQEKRLRDAIKADADRINKDKTVTPPVAPATATVSDGSGSKPKVGPTDAEISKAKQRLESLTNEISSALNTMDDNIGKKVALTLDERLQAIKDNHTNLVNKINELAKYDPKAAKGFSAKLQSDNDKLVLLEIKKFNDEVLAKKQTLESAIETIESQAGKKEKASLDARLTAIVDVQKDKYREIEDYRRFLSERSLDTKPADELKTRLDKSVEELKLAEKKLFFLDGIALREKAISDLISERTARIEMLNIQEKAGLITNNQVRESSKAIIDEIQPKLVLLSEEALTFANNIDKGFSPEKIAEFIVGISKAKASASELNSELFSAQNLSEMLSVSGSSGVENIAKGFGEAIVGAQSWGDALRGVRNAFLNFAADFLRQIAMMIIKQQILNALQSMGSSDSGGFMGTIAGALNTMVLHDGGLVGAGVSLRTRSVDPSMFIGAPRYHTGGIAGLSPTEYPAILQKNEEVLKSSDPRNVLNGGTKTSAPGKTVQDIKVINHIDSASVVSEGLSTSEGTRAILNVIRANRSSIKNVLG